MIKKIVEVPVSSLREKSKKILKLDKKTKALIKDMKDTLESQDDPEGIGLAAPQIGKNVQIFIVNYKSTKITVINPKVLELSGKPKGKYKATDEKTLMEGCLSLPHYYGPLKRAKKVTISYKDENWNSKTETFEDFLAQIILHEIDHLKGVIFIDRLLEQNAPLYKVTNDEWEEVEL